MFAGLAPSRKLGTILCIRCTHLKLSTINSILASCGRILRATMRSDKQLNKSQQLYRSKTYLTVSQTYTETLRAICGTSSHLHQFQQEASVQCTHLADASIFCERGALQSLGVQVRCLEKVLTWVIGVVPGVQVFWDGHAEFWAPTFRMLPLMTGVDCRVNFTVGGPLRWQPLFNDTFHLHTARCVARNRYQH